MTAKEHKPAVVIDIDNTLLDTAIRKEALLRAKFGVEAPLDSIRKDFDLSSILGTGNEISNKFFSTLDSKEAYLHEAPPFPGAVDAISWLRMKGIHIIFLSGRLESLTNETIQELRHHGIYLEGDDLTLFPSSSLQQGIELQAAIFDFKKKVIAQLASQFRLLAAIGDRPEDIESAQNSNVPAILLTSTLATNEVERLQKVSSSGLEVCESWAAITASFEQIRLGTIQMEKLREIFTTQYASWLRDIDEKIKAVISIAAILSAISGQKLLNSEKFDLGTALLFFTLGFSILSILFCLRGITSRRTSGNFASLAIKGHLKQMIAILFGRPRTWLYREGDAIDAYSKLTRLSSREQATVHLKFFYSEYHTFNPEALLNLRMLELRSTNYSKAYAERIASNMLTTAICFLFLWLMLHMHHIVTSAPLQ